MATQLTASELQVLRELDGAPDKTLSYSTLLSAAPYSMRLTQRGMRTVLNRLEDRSLVARDGGNLQLTFGAVRALAEASFETVSA